MRRRAPRGKKPQPCLDTRGSLWAEGGVWAALSFHIQATMGPFPTCTGAAKPSGFENFRRLANVGGPSSGSGRCPLSQSHESWVLAIVQQVRKGLGRLTSWTADSGWAELVWVQPEVFRRPRTGSGPSQGTRGTDGLSVNADTLILEQEAFQVYEKNGVLDSGDGSTVPNILKSTTSR